MRSREADVGGWGRVPVEPARLYRPERWSELAEIVRDADPARGAISRGLGRAYADAALNAGGSVVLHTRLDRLLAFDPASGVLEAEAGVSLAELLRVFVPRGWFLPVTPGTKFVTLGGAVAADVHGKNHHRDGSLFSALESLRLLTASGEILDCSRAENRDAFLASVGGLGLTGAILSARLRLQRIESAYLRADQERTRDLDDTLARFSSGDDAVQFSSAWIDCLATGRSLGRCVLYRGNWLPRAELPARLRAQPLRTHRDWLPSVPLDFPNFALNRLSMGAFNVGYYAVHPTRLGFAQHYDPHFYPLDVAHGWNRVYGKRGFVQYQLVVPPETGRDALVQVLERCVAARMGSFLAVLKKFGPGNEAILSFPRPGYTLALDFPNTGAGLVALARDLDRIVLAHGGRVYLAKDALLDRSTFEAMYPEATRFREIKAKLDPEQRFASSLARRVGLVEAR
jgi:decaprenylphospho-beta-D-ribofuranose 2-oxidase